MDLLKLRMACEDAGLRLSAIENTPIEFYDKIMLGQAGRDEQIENMQATICNMGLAGIPIFGYHFVVTGVWRTSNTAGIAVVPRPRPLIWILSKMPPFL
ncbi:MAG: mannonate dehydratase [Caldilineaceae bacterium]